MPNLVPRFRTCLGRGRSGYEMQSGNVTEGHICRCESATLSLVRLVPRRSLLPCSRRKINSGKGARVPPLSVVSQLTAQSRFDWARNTLSPKGYVHNIPDSFCAGKKTIPDRASVHDKNGDFRAISITVLSCAFPISKVESRIMDLCSQYTQLFIWAPKKHYAL